ncbi:hypothetical protein IGJ94_002824 [Enterococcus sp. AZ153]
MSSLFIYSGALVKAYRYGRTLEITTSNGLNRQTIKVLPNKQYVVLKTGEIRDMNTSAENRADNLKAVKQTMKKLRRLIAHNFNGGNNQLWITLTYKENITDYKLASKDYKLFMKNLRKSYKNLEYISVIEPQASGRWHFHILLKSDTTLFISNDEIARCWGKGYTNTKRLKSSDKVGNYVLAYLSNLDLPADKNNQSKKYVKGARLYFYPKGIRIYRRSKGIQDPITETASKNIIMKKNHVTNRKANYSTKTVHQAKTGPVTYITEFYDDLD